MVIISGAGGSRSDINRALSFLINQSGYKENPFLMMAYARTTIYRNNIPAWSGTAVDDLFISEMGVERFDAGLYAEMIRGFHKQEFVSKSFASISGATTAANNSLFSQTPKITRLEAAAINRWASQMYDEIDIPGEANNRRWIDRFLSMTDEERKSYQDGDVISILQPGVNVVRQKTGAEQDLAEMIKERASQVEKDDKTDRIGSQLPPTDHRTSEMYQKSTDTYETVEQDINTKKRSKQQGYKPRLKEVVIKKQQPYAQANFWADGYGAIFTLYLEAAKWNKFSLRMAAVTNYIREKERLERQIRNERVRLKPPRPEITLKHIQAFNRQGRITANPDERQKIAAMLGLLYVLLEEGRAFYR